MSSEEKIYFNVSVYAHDVADHTSPVKKDLSKDQIESILERIEEELLENGYADFQCEQAFTIFTFDPKDNKEKVVSGKGPKGLSKILSIG